MIVYRLAASKQRTNMYSCLQYSQILNLISICWLVLRHKTVYTTQAPGASNSRNRVTQQHFEIPELAESVASRAAPEAVTAATGQLEVVERPADPTKPSGAPLSRPSVMLEAKRPEWYKEEMKSNDPIRAARPAPARRVSESMFRMPSASGLPTDNEVDPSPSVAESDGPVAASQQDALASSRRSDVV